MIFQLDVAFATELIALILATALLVVLRKWEIKCVFPKAVGIFAVVASLLGMLCTAYYGYQYRAQGYFASPFMKMEKAGIKGEMMKDECQMMEKMMGSETQSGKHGDAGPGNAKPAPSPDDHSAHH